MFDDNLAEGGLVRGKGPTQDIVSQYLYSKAPAGMKHVDLGERPRPHFVEDDRVAPVKQTQRAEARASAALASTVLAINFKQVDVVALRAAHSDG